MIFLANCKDNKVAAGRCAKKIADGSWTCQDAWVQYMCRKSCKLCFGYYDGHPLNSKSAARSKQIKWSTKALTLTVQGGGGIIIFPPPLENLVFQIQISQLYQKHFKTLTQSKC